jgi:hypothetical protein
MSDPILGRIRAIDWSSQAESTVCSQLIMPVLMLLGYGEHTLHKVREQRSYPLKDPTMMKGSRNVRLDYEPRVYEEGLWVMEAKGTDATVDPSTLGQVRDYSIHPEVRAALMVTVDAAGFRVFDPWDKDWDEPLLSVAPNDVADRFEDLRAVLGVDRVADVVRRRHLDHLRRALSASLEFGVLVEAEREFRELIAEARKQIDQRRREIHRDAMRASEELRQRVLRNSGAWGVAQHHNSPWTGSIRDTRELAVAVLAQPEPQRLTEIRQFWRAIEAVFRGRCADGAPLRRPLWWAHVVALGGALQLRGQPGCEPDATELAHQAVRDCLLGFPDDAAAAASWRLQRVAIPLACRVADSAPLDELARKTQEKLTAEQRLRMRIDPGWFLGHLVRMAMIDLLASIEPWTAQQLDRQADEARAQLARLPIPSAEWHGPVTDPWLIGWDKRDELLMCGLAVLETDVHGDELVLADAELQRAILDAAGSDDELLRRPAVPLAERLGLA